MLRAAESIQDSSPVMLPNCTTGQLDGDDAYVQLLPLCKQVDLHTACVIRGIAKAMCELSLQAIKNKQSVSEYELTTTYFHPILSCILSSPDKRVLLRWANVESDASGKKRPDATLSKVTQLAYGPSLGFGEAKGSFAKKPLMPTIGMPA
ncbi:hypothetical protein HMPREF1544_03513 [Mucor circinelloides 1006PhL]|uniref:Uncharacterized protein n=1 Tax=Mucor circinelloides f. circinelloides (strain 1006PhL) TaxID=1220926 RepID=S2K355_MUCC1|nr:hypothetical protein HMPREF1544_03513 [Mucor circinelloides 1006PhL]